MLPFLTRCFCVCALFACQAHPFFASIDWARLARREIPPPITPDSTKANCTADADLADQLLDRKPRDIPLDQQQHFRGWRFRTEISRPEPAPVSQNTPPHSQPGLGNNTSIASSTGIIVQEKPVMHEQKHNG